MTSTRTSDPELVWLGPPLPARVRARIVGRRELARRPTMTRPGTGDH